MATVTYEDFVGTVAERAELPGEDARRAACATLTTLAERLSTGEVADLAERLPDGLRPCLDEAASHEAFHADEFLRRVGRRAELDDAAARRAAQALFIALGRSVGAEELQDVRSELPKDFDPLLDEALRETPDHILGVGTGEPAISLDAFLDRVAQLADLGGDRERARRAAEAVLEVLAIRVTGGQVEDLAPRLPPELRDALARGLTAAGRAARPISATEFVEQVQRREDDSKGEATQHIRAVMQALREAIGEDEYRDTVAQLPDEYRTLLRPR
jgi:uncharacterized protein (DUF2267 family)